MASTSHVSPEAGIGKPPRENLYRSNNSGDAVELRESAKGSPVLTGHAAVFDTFTEIRSSFEGHFLERIAPGAFAKTISENRDRIRVLFNHGKDPTIGDKPLGPLTTLEEDATGLRYAVDLLPTSYNADLEPGLRAGLYGASFRFSTVREDFQARPARSEHNPDGIPERTLQEVKLMELGPVTFGAYPQATSGIRSVTDDVLAAQFLQDDEFAARFAAQFAKKPKRDAFTVSFNGTRLNIPTEPERADMEALDLLGQMADLAVQFIGGEADDQGDASDQEAMNQILAQIQALQKEEQTEPDSDGTGSSDDPRAATPEPSEATTSVEPEPSAATTRSASTSLFWFVDSPAHLRS